MHNDAMSKCRSPKSHATVCVIAAVAMALSASADALAGSFKFDRCKPDVDAAYAALGIDAAKVSRVVNEPVVLVGEDKVLTGYRMWLSSNACKGRVAINFSLQCDLIDSFERGECGLDDFAR